MLNHVGRNPVDNCLSAAALMIFLAIGGQAKAADPASGGDRPAATAEATPRDYDAILRQGTLGPASVALRDVASIDLPADYAFIPRKPAAELMRQLGNDTDDNLIGMILPGEPSGWFIDMEYLPSGHIEDDDARNWNPDDLLKSIRENTETGNKERRKRGDPELEVVGWAEKPRYDDAARRLAWSVEARQKGAAEDAASIVNYRALMLGREGYVSMVMVTDLSHIEADKPFADLLLSKLAFVDGERYGDFNASTDKVAEYGLAAVVAGVAVKKLGLIALVGAFVLKFAKVIAVAVFGGLAAFRRFFRRSGPVPASAGAAVGGADTPVVTTGLTKTPE